MTLKHYPIQKELYRTPHIYDRKTWHRLVLQPLMFEIAEHVCAISLFNLYRVEQLRMNLLTHLICNGNLVTENVVNYTNREANRVS